jgi:hypothetical protein
VLAEAELADTSGQFIDDDTSILLELHNGDDKPLQLAHDLVSHEDAETALTAIAHIRRALDVLERFTRDWHETQRDRYENPAYVMLDEEGESLPKPPPLPLRGPTF